ncbi:MAG TPA: beta-galactosidase [Spirochaetota bacterium]|nr:beta-galactosidase [Candidatus Omnitrophota bacterium]HPO45124.1 beta-galactosidase [Spirochaetota bacterium]
MKKSIELKKGEFLVNGKPFFIFSGEIHYFRIARRDWEDRIKKAKDSGLNTFSSYIPWAWHEYKEGSFDFTGRTKPERDLLGLFELLNKHGLYFFCRPGPVTHGEIQGHGVPLWLTQKYPEVRLKKKDGSDFDTMVVSHNNPFFLKMVGKWYSKVMPIIAKNQVTRGGNVIAVQLDNEISMINWLAKQFDYSENATQMYRGFLEEKYKTIGKLNREYGSCWASFGEVEQPDGNIEESGMAAYWDWANFCRRYYAVFYGSLAAMAKKHGINVPLVANIAHFYDYSTCGRGVHGMMTTSMFRDFREYVPDVVFGGAYQMRRLDYENFHDVALLSETVKMITKPGVPSIVVEMQSGIMNDRPRLYPSDVDLNLKTSAGHGLNGINCYMFCGGKSPKELAARSSYHEWQAPVSADGSEKPHLQPIRNFGRFLKANNSELAASRKACDLSVGVYMPYYMTEYMKGRLADDIASLRDRLFFDGIGRLLVLAGFNFNMIDIERAAQAEINRARYLCVFSLDFMDRATQLKLASYVKQGGKMLLNFQLPDKDLLFRPETALADALGIEAVGKTTDNIVDIYGIDCLTDSWTSTFKAGGSKVLGKVHGKGMPCVIKKKAGKGEAVVAGIGLPHTFDYHVEIVRKLCGELGLRIPGGSPAPEVHRVKRVSAGAEFDFMMNYHDEPKMAIVNGQRTSLHNRSGIIIKIEK